MLFFNCYYVYCSVCDYSCNIFTCYKIQHKVSRYEGSCVCGQTLGIAPLPV